MQIHGLMTIVETPAFLDSCRKLLDENDRELLVSHLAAHPDSGDLIPGTGGLRKMRWALEGRGKRGGARVIYFLLSERMPIFLLTAYAKNQRSDLSAAERAEFKKLTKQLAVAYESKKS